MMETCDIEGKFIRLNDEIIGINLGYSFATEHEMGIGKLRDAFGHKRDELGFEGYVNTIVPIELHLCDGKPAEKEDYVALIYPSYVSYPSYVKSILNHGYQKTDPEYQKAVDVTCRNIADRALNLYGDREIAGAWSEHDFGVKVRRDNAQVLENLLDAFNSKKGVLMLGSREFLGNSGLTLLDYAKIPEDEKKKARDEHKKAIEERILRKKLEKESGLLELLKDAGKDWLYLGVDRLDEDGNPRWWLNPSDQQNNNAGWYDTEDLRLWAEGKGPVVKSKKQIRRETKERGIR
jgi:hypothetical protein